MTFTYFWKVKNSNQGHFGKLNVIMLQTVTDRTNVTIANTQEVAYWLSNDVNKFELDPF